MANIFGMAKFAGKGLGMTATRIGGGAAIGGIVGGIASDSNTGTGWIGDVAKGVLIGGAIGTAGAALGARSIARQASEELGTRAPRSLLSKLGSGMWSGGKAALKVGSGMWSGGKAALKGGSFAARKGWGALKWVNKNPGTFGTLAVGATALTALAMSGPQNANRSASQMAQVAMLEGRPSTGFEVGQGSDRYAFEQSTMGLVQGMHNGRHRG